MPTMGALSASATAGGAAGTRAAAMASGAARPRHTRTRSRDSARLSVDRWGMSDLLRIRLNWVPRLYFGPSRRALTRRLRGARAGRYKAAGVVYWLAIRPAEALSANRCFRQ